MAQQTKKAPAKAATKSTSTKAALKSAPVKDAVKNAPAKDAVKSAKPAAKSVTLKPESKKLPDLVSQRPNMVNIYLTFNGNCEEAFNFYKKVLGGEFAVLSRFSDMPPIDGREVPLSEGKKIMHVSLPVSRETALMGSDTMEGMGPRVTMGNNFSISLSVGSTTEADRVYKALSAKGNATMPMSPTFWGSYFGMLEDKFGIHWMISFDQPQPQN